MAKRLDRKQDILTIGIACPCCRYETKKDAIYRRGDDKSYMAAVTSTYKELIDRWNRAWSWNKTVNGEDKGQ